MISGSVEVTDVTLKVKHFETVHNYHTFRNSLLGILSESGYADPKNEKEANTIALGALRTILGTEKLSDFLRHLMPPRSDLN